MAGRHEFLLERIRREREDRLSPGVTTVIRVAGTRVALHADDARILRSIEREFAGFFAGDGPVDAEAWLVTPDGTDPTHWEDPDPEFHILGDGMVQRDVAARRLAGGQRGTDPHRAVAHLGHEARDALHNFLRWFLAPVLLERGAFLLHAAGIVARGRGFVFFGPSGAGKSTVSALSRQADPSAVVVGDDCVIVRKAADSDSCVLHAAPFGGSPLFGHPPALEAPLAAFCQLRQSSDEDRIQPLTGSEGVAALLASVMGVWGPPDSLPCLDLAHAFALSKPGITRLRFRRTPAFWNCLGRPDPSLTIRAPAGDHEAR